MNNGFFEYNKQLYGRCNGCQDSHIVYTNGGWSFYGCYCVPYHGKWVAEIQNCPKDKTEKK